MSSARLTARIALFAGGAAIVAMGALTSCSSGTEKETPSTTPSSPATSSAATPTPLRKGLGPGDNSFTPSINPARRGSLQRGCQRRLCAVTRPRPPVSMKAAAAVAVGTVVRARWRRLNPTELERLVPDHLPHRSEIGHQRGGRAGRRGLHRLVQV